MATDRPTVVPTHPRIAALERLGNEIAELSAHLDAATARLLALRPSTWRTASPSPRGRHVRSGWASGSTWAGRSTCCIRWRRESADATT